MLPAHKLQGELAIPVPRYRHPRATITAGKGWGICRFTHTSQTCRARTRNAARPHLQRCDRAERLTSALPTTGLGQAATCIRFGSSSHVQNGSLSHPQDLDGPMRVAAQRRNNAYKQHMLTIRTFLFSPLS